MCDTYTHAFMTRSGKTAFSFTVPDLFANLIFFHKQNKQTKTTPPKKEQKEKSYYKNSYLQEVNFFNAILPCLGIHHFKNLQTQKHRR